MARVQGLHRRTEGVGNRRPRQLPVDRRVLAVGPGKWWTCVQTACGDLHVHDQPADTPAWALQRAKHRVRDIERAHRNHDGRHGVMYPRGVRIVRVLAVRAPSLQAVLAALAGHVARGIGWPARLALGVRRVVICRLAAVAARNRERRQARAARRQEVRFALAIARAVARQLGRCWQPLCGPKAAPGYAAPLQQAPRAVARQVAGLLRSGSPGALALAGRLGVDGLQLGTA